MTLPLVVLALLAAVGGVLNLPFGKLDLLHRWLEPVLPAAIAPTAPRHRPQADPRASR